MKTGSKRIVIVVSEDIRDWVIAEAKRKGGWTANAVLVHMREVYKRSLADERNAKRAARMPVDRQDDAEPDTTGV